MRAARRVQVDDPRVARPRLLEPHAEPLGGARPHVVGDRVRPAQQPIQGRGESRVLEVERDAALARLRAAEWPRDAAQLVTERGLELDDVGPQVGEQP